MATEDVSTSWNNETTLEFINSIYYHPEIWDPTDPNRKMKKIGWNDIAYQYDITSETAQKKFKCLRTYAMREEKKLEAKMKSSGMPVESTWFAYTSMSFIMNLKTHEKKEKKTKRPRMSVKKDPDNLEINGEPNAEAIFISVPPAETSGSVSLEASSCESPLKNRNSVTFQPIKTVTVPSGKISEYHGSIRAEDEFDLFGKSMASHLRKMPLLAALECQSKIQSYIIQKRIEITSSSDVSIKQGQ